MENRAVRRRRSAFAAFLATLVMALGFTAVPADAAPQEQVDYVALGDSYTAGTGAGPFTWTFPCIQTRGGYVDIVDSQPLVKLEKNAACHGALLKAFAEPGHVPSVKDQIVALKAAGSLSYSTELVSLTAGANDAGVNSTLFICGTSTSEACKEAVTASVQSLPLVAADLVRSLGAIRQAAPKAKIAVLGYPRLFDPVGGYPVIPPTNQTLVNQGTALLNATLAASVATARALYHADAQYIDVTSRFSGHAVNNVNQSWLCFEPLAPCIPTVPNPVPGGDPIPDPRNFHPNAAGHLAYASALTEAVNLTALARR